MREVFEIFAAVMAVFGIYTVLDMLRERLLYPYKIRRLTRVAIIADENVPLAEIAAYVGYLSRERKISPERLIILTNSDIIIGNSEISRFGDVFVYNKYKEADDDREYEVGRESP
ncbi:MAG: hypothetical protein IJY93_00155 [Clostridia bacterium]|nr:hypothetical protein [Clostridia bacterium]